MYREKDLNISSAETYIKCARYKNIDCIYEGRLEFCDGCIYEKLYKENKKKKKSAQKTV